MKDIWSWLYDVGSDNDRNRVDELVDDLMAANHAGDTERIQSVGDQLINFGTSINQPWLGVFGRHWQLQHRLTTLSEGRTAVADAVSAFELAHRDESVGCPQTICATQDLCIAYSVTDGPGYADEVIAACQDTLERIDPTWPCFDCVSTEMVTGLINAEQFDDAVDLIKETEVEIRRAGANPSYSYLWSHLDALLKLERNADAFELATTLDEDRYAQHSEWGEHVIRHHQARALLRAGDVEQAVSIYQTRPSPLAEPALAFSWALVTDELLAADAIANDDPLSTTAVRLAHLLHRRGALRLSFDIATLAGRAAARRGAAGSARRCRALASTIRSELVDPSMVDDAMAALDNAIGAMPATVSNTAPVDEAVDELESRPVEALSVDEQSQLAQLLVGQGWEDAAEQILRNVFDRRPTADSARNLLETLLFNGDHDAVEALAAEAVSIDPLLAEWGLARSAAMQRRWIDVADHCASIVKQEPTAMNTRRLWITATRELGDFSTGARLATELLDSWEPADEGEPSPDLWPAVVAGSLAENWTLVRRAARDIGFTLDDEEGPIDESWETCFVTFIDERGQDMTLQAQRTGPATARIVQITLPGDHQRLGDLVIFEPSPLDPPPEDPEEARYTPMRYPVITTIEDGNATAFVLQCPTPSDEQWPTLRDAVFEAGFAIWSYGGGSYDFEGEEVPYLYAMAAHWPGQTPNELQQLLDRLTEDWHPRPLYLELAEATGAGLEQQQRIDAERWA